MMYGMGPGLLGQRLGCSREEAEQIVQDFYTGFPQVQKWMRKTESDAFKNGYVEDFWGRRRRLPDIQLPKFEVYYSKKNDNYKFNPILGAKNKYIDNNTFEIKSYKKRAEECQYKKDLEALKSEAEAKGICIQDNNGFISLAQRQCVNARVQGGAATMTKKAMINIYNDEEMRNLGFKILIGVHDELIGECPKENAEAVADRLSLLMRTSVPELNVPFKCDAEIEDHWYKNEYESHINNEYRDLLEKDADTALDKLYINHSELTKEHINSILENVGE